MKIGFRELGTIAAMQGYLKFKNKKIALFIFRILNLISLYCLWCNSKYKDCKEFQFDIACIFFKFTLWINTCKPDEYALSSKFYIGFGIPYHRNNLKYFSKAFSKEWNIQKLYNLN